MGRHCGGRYASAHDGRASRPVARFVGCAVGGKCVKIVALGGIAIERGGGACLIAAGLAIAVGHEAAQRRVVIALGVVHLLIQHFAIGIRICAVAVKAVTVKLIERRIVLPVHVVSGLIVPGLIGACDIVGIIGVEGAVPCGLIVVGGALGLFDGVEDGIVVEGAA